MAGLKDCIDRLHQAGEITLEDAHALKKRYDNLAKQVLPTGAARDQMVAELEAAAADKARRAALTENARQRNERAILNHVNASGYRDPAEALMWLLEHNGQARFQDVQSRMMAIRGMVHAKMERALHEFSAKAKITGDMARRFGRTAARLDNVVREMFGEKTGDQSAAELAMVISDTMEGLRQQFNAAGGAIGKLDRYGAPQHHNQEALIKAGRGQWVEYITPLLDRERMRHPLTGQRLSDDDLQESLEFIWERITTDGWSTREPSGAIMGKGALFKQHADHRFLHFKDADSWLKYQKDFGEGDPWSSIMGHISTMTRDIAFMEVLGPNPVAMMTYLKQLVQAHAARAKPNNVIRDELLTRIRRTLAKAPQSMEERQYELAKATTELYDLRRRIKGANQQTATRLQKQIDAKNAEVERLGSDMLDNLSRMEWPDPDADEPLGSQVAMNKAVMDEMADLLAKVRQEMPDHFDDPMSRARDWIKSADSVFDIMRGSQNTPVNRTLANTMAGLRNISTASKLGSAAVSAITDVSFQKATRVLAGMPKRSIIKSVITGYVRQLMPGGQQAGVRAGLILDSAMHVMDKQARYAAATDFAGTTGYIADRVLALSGLSPLTTAGKHAFGLDLQAHMVDTLALPFDELTPEWRGFLERNGFNAADWDRLKAVPVHTERGVSFLRPKDVEAAGDRELALKVLAMIHRFTKMAVPEPTVRARAAMQAGTAPGTPSGEAIRLAMQFKGFSVGVMFLHGTSIYQDVARAQGLLGKAGGAARAIPLLINLTILGALAIQIKELINGKDPRSMDDPKFWGAAFMQGGGLGIYGDFLFSDVNRFGGGLADTLAGPVVGSIVDPARNLIIGNIAEGMEGKDTNIGRESVAFLKKNMPGGNLWYSRLIWERMVLDQLRRYADPEADRAFRRMMRKRQKDFKQEYWWAPGETEPRRNPDLGASVSVR